MSATSTLATALVAFAVVAAWAGMTFAWIAASRSVRPKRARVAGDLHLPGGSPRSFAAFHRDVRREDRARRRAAAKTWDLR